MKPRLRALQAALILSVLCRFAVPAFADDAAKAATPTPTAALHELAATPAAPAVAAVATPTEAPEQAEDADTDRKPKHHHHGNDDDRVGISDSVTVAATEEVNGSAVGVMGSVTVDGTVNGDAVAVMGRNTINGTVHGSVVSVLGSMTLGPNARVDGDVVCIGPKLDKSPTAIVGGQIVHKSVGFDFGDSPEWTSWMQHGIGEGRPFSLGHHLHIFWIISSFIFAFYILIALAFPEGIVKTGETLARRPAATFLTGILAMLALPIVFVLLLITVVGIPVALVVLPLTLIACVFFGKTAIYALVGRSILGKQGPVFVAVILGTVLFVVLFLVPFLGGLLWLMVAFLGFSSAVTTLFTTNRPPVPPAVPPAAAAAVVAAVAPAPGGEPSVPMAAEIPAIPAVAAVPPAGPAPVPSAVAESGLPRAGFWIRMVALVIDFFLVAIVTRMHALFVPALAAYAAILWKLKGATVGDIIFGLKVVRQDGRENDWATVIVRALGCLLSLLIMGLGFFWIAFDPEKQGWHDKIAGTVVVQLPKTAPLV